MYDGHREVRICMTAIGSQDMYDGHREVRICMVSQFGKHSGMGARGVGGAGRQGVESSPGRPSLASQAAAWAAT